jgi:hypothetical protein
MPTAAASSLIIDIEVELHNPALSKLQMPAVRRPVADRDHDARRFAGLQYGDDLVGLGTFEVRFDELVATALRRLQNWNVALLRPLLKAIGSAMQRARLTGYKCR